MKDFFQKNKTFIAIIIVGIIWGIFSFFSSPQDKVNTPSNSMSEEEAYQEYLKIAKDSYQFIGSYEREKSPITPLLPITKSTTCSFNRINGVSFEVREKENEVGHVPYSEEEKAKIYYESSMESQPNIVSFIDLDTKNPKMVANIGQDELIKIYDDEEIIHMVEKIPLNSGSINLYTIYKKDGLAIWTKQYIFINVPLGYMAMGYCK
ncbi:MAG: hypothetical protein Q7T34_00475 [Candidatus Parcubacteria bacterium]|nr:hypothetical protein [Candidatus Parcubacteria bacterium]